jgi:hypothetical protein
VTATDPLREHSHPDRAADRCAARPSYQDTATRNPIPDRSSLITEIITFVLCGLSAVIVLVLVARHAWPVWWLVIAGMLIAWAGDAAWSVGDRLVDTATIRRAGSDQPAPRSRAGEPR